MISVDADNDDTYTEGNTDGVVTDPNKAPRMTLALLELFPTNAEGLASAIRVDSNAEVSNSTT